MFELHALEIIYLTALTGGSSFPGLDIDLEGESERSLRSLMDKQMRSLEEKGYLETDFMGNAHVKEGLHEFIRLASGCTAYLCQIIQRHQQQLKVYYFFRDGTWFELEYQPDGSSYRLQEIYAWHELVFRVLNRSPLVEGLDHSGPVLPADEESDLAGWVGQCLLNGAAMLSLADIQCTGGEARIERELTLLIHEDHMSLLRLGIEGQMMRIPVYFAAAVEGLIAWLQEIQRSEEAGHVHSINNVSV
ncbi:hypothetical protein [Paenibacillus sp. MMS20-IR301]|uniref:hypothetical protein n=1 Tax=Paenibacillus sp. MMS20-IR301 TaxID=2895946 RepID=UPI0028EBEF1A|nr:hypothetical protein [Paenibacillus sp. MMS20-IR301]WNS41081.1 hypothetical protein LOS79_18740 [Paenibacillus sp. MMS20-IR301]